MNENLLQFIWQNRFFGTGPFFTEEGMALDFVHVGEHNLNQGPDFLNARIKIDNTLLVGNVEIHVLASDWFKHGHDNDANYRNVILHVVWCNNLTKQEKDIFSIFTFCIQPYISHHLLGRYTSLMQGNSFVKPCASFLSTIKPLIWSAWKERLLVERLERKALKINLFLTEKNNDWETITWWLLASNFGLKVNEQLFETVAKSLPLKIIAKHRHHIQQLEALLLGQANLLESTFESTYPKQLQREFRFLQNKYHLEKLFIAPAFLRMRPASFPTLRLAQLASLVHTFDRFFDMFKTENNLSSLRNKCCVEPSDYWMNHYSLEDRSTLKKKKLGIKTINNILLNTAIPILYAYGLKGKEPFYQEKALNWLYEISGEQNRVIKEWNACHVKSRNAFDSQALLELTNRYCQHKKCLSCAIGINILSNSI